MPEHLVKDERLLEYLRNRNMLVHADVTEDEIDERMRRVDQNCVCDECGKLYREHPYIDDTLDWMDGRPYLHLLCSGVLAKL